MNAAVSAQIRENPHFKELIARRGRLSWMLSAIMLGIYVAFILVIAFLPEVLAAPLTSGSVMTVGIPVGVVIILMAVVLTGIYVRKANTEFDRLTQAIKETVR